MIRNWLLTCIYFYSLQKSSSFTLSPLTKQIINSKHILETRTYQIKDPNIFTQQENLFNESNDNDQTQALLFGAPLTIPIIAFNTFEAILNTFHNTLNILSNKIFTSYDFAAMDADTASIENRIVLTCVTFLFATVASVMISGLREVS